MKVLTIDYHQKAGIVSIDFYHEHELCELQIDAALKEIDFMRLNEFLSAMIKSYRLDLFSIDTLAAIAEQLFLLGKGKHALEEIESFVNDLAGHVNLVTSLLLKAENIIKAYPKRKKY